MNKQTEQQDTKQKGRNRAAKKKKKKRNEKEKKRKTINLTNLKIVKKKVKGDTWW